MPTREAILNKRTKVSSLRYHAILNAHNDAVNTATHYTTSIVFSVEVARDPATTMAEEYQWKVTTSSIRRMVHPGFDVRVDLFFS
jgi:hypothetical protein